MEKLKIKALKIAIVAIMLSAVLVSCKKESSPLIEPATLKISNKMAVIPTHVFDWETTDYMPTPVGLPPILVPWASGSNQLFSDEIAFDYKKADGWNLVYNTFSPTQVTSPNFFALYNKYTGMLRFYLYIPPGNINASSYLSDGLNVSGSFSSSLMNFTNEIVDRDNVVTSLARIQNYQIQSTGAWYACQYEMAYDPNISNANPQNLNFIWNTSSTNISNVNLNGESSGTLTGTIGVESPGGFNLGNLLGQGANAALYFAGLKAINGVTGLNSEVKDAIKDGAKSGLSGAVKGFLSAILGGSPSVPQVVNLTLKTKSTITGTITNSSGIASPTLAIPGASTQNNTVGYLPFYNNPLGVFYLKEKPKVYIGSPQVQLSNGESITNNLSEYNLTYGLVKTPAMGIGDVAKFTRSFFNSDKNNGFIVYNPLLLNEGTTFKILRQDIMIPLDTPPPFYITESQTSSEMMTKLHINNSSESGGEFYSGIEEIGGQKYVSFGTGDEIILQTAIDSYVHPTSGKFIDNIRAKDTCIRYTILVTPPNGAAPITIVKTFKAEVIKLD